MEGEDASSLFPPKGPLSHRLQLLGKAEDVSVFRPQLGSDALCLLAGAGSTCEGILHARLHVGVTTLQRRQLGLQLTTVPNTSNTWT